MKNRIIALVAGLAATLSLGSCSIEIVTNHVTCDTYLTCYYPNSNDPRYTEGSFELDHRQLCDEDITAMFNSLCQDVPPSISEAYLQIDVFDWYDDPLYSVEYYFWWDIDTKMYLYEEILQ